MDKRDEMRMTLWHDVYVANMLGPTRERPTECANAALAMFDQTFPEPPRIPLPQAVM